MVKLPFIYKAVWRFPPRPKPTLLFHFIINSKTRKHSSVTAQYLNRIRAQHFSAQRILHFSLAQTHTGQCKFQTQSKYPKHTQSKTQINKIPENYQTLSQVLEIRARPVAEPLAPFRCSL